VDSRGCRPGFAPQLFYISSGSFVENFVDYFPERPEESSFLYLVNLNPILIRGITLYLSAPKPKADAHHFSPVLHFLM
jgi:hypothetical protein